MHQMAKIRGVSRKCHKRHTGTHKLNPIERIVQKKNPTNTRTILMNKKIFVNSRNLNHSSTHGLKILPLLRQTNQKISHVSHDHKLFRNNNFSILQHLGNPCTIFLEDPFPQFKFSKQTDLVSPNPMDPQNEIAEIQILD